MTSSRADASASTEAAACGQQRDLSQSKQSCHGVGATSPAVTDDGVFVSAACGDLSAFDRLTGSLLWHHLATCGSFSGQPMVFDGRVYVEEDEPGAQVDMFDVGTGGLLASLPCFIPPAFDEGQAYCNQRTPLEAFDLTTGAPTWSYSGDRQLNLGPFAAAGTVYVASDTGMIFGVDEATGTQVWSTEVDGLGASSFTVGGEGVLLTQLYASAGVVAYAHVDVPDASVVLGDGATPAPFTLIAGVHPLALALDDTNVYWADFQAGVVGAAPKSGGSPVTTLWSSTTTAPRAIAVDATNVYVLASGDIQGNPTEIAAVPKGGGTPLPLASSPSLLTGPLVAGPSLVYWLDGTLQSVPETGGTVTAVPPGFVAAALAVDGSSLYWSALDGIHSEPFSGGAPQLLGVPPNPTAVAPSSASALAVDATNHADAHARSSGTHTAVAIGHGAKCAIPSDSVTQILPSGPEVIADTSKGRVISVVTPAVVMRPKFADGCVGVPVGANHKFLSLISIVDRNAGNVAREDGDAERRGRRQHSRRCRHRPS